MNLVRTLGPQTAGTHKINLHTIFRNGMHSRALARENFSLVVYWTPVCRPSWNQHSAGIDLNSLPEQPADVSGPTLYGLSELCLA
jgi:hypothetical protein